MGGRKLTPRLPFFKRNLSSKEGVTKALIFRHNVRTSLSARTLNTSCIFLFMTEKELIGKIRELRQIKPRKEWVFSVKKDILRTLPGARTLDIGEEPKIKWSSILDIFSYKPVLAGAVTVSFLILFSLFVSSQNSLPGDLLYPVKKITEKIQAVFVSGEEKQMVQLELANKRLEELSKITQKNQVEKLAPAIKEYQASVSEAAKNIKKITKEIIQQNQKMEETKARIELSLGVKIDEAENLENTITNKIAEAKTAEVQIKDLEGSTLNEAQQKTLEETKQAFEDGNYRLALELIQLLPSQR